MVPELGEGLAEEVLSFRRDLVASDLADYVSLTSLGKEDNYDEINKNDAN